LSLILADTSVWARERQPSVGAMLADSIQADALAIVLPLTLELLRSAQHSIQFQIEAKRYDTLHQLEITPLVARRAREVQQLLTRRGNHRGPSAVDLMAAAAAESVDAELWHCDRRFELIAEVTGQPMRRVGT